MALLFLESFDHLTTANLGAKWTSVGGTPTIGTSYKRSGANGCECSYGDQLNITLAPTTTDRGVCGFAVYRTDGQYQSLIQIRNGNGPQFYVSVLSDSTIQLYDGNNAVLGSKSTATVSATTWHYLEVKWTIADSPNGSVQVYLNGDPTPIVNVTGGDTKVQSAATWTSLRIGGNSVGGTIWIDDIYVCDQGGSYNNDFLGDITVEALLPQTDAVDPGSNADWTCSTGGDHGALVDENPPNDSDYVSTDTTGDYDTWNYPDLSVASADIKGVQVSTYAKKTDTGSGTYVNVARPTTTNRDGTTSIAPSDTSYSYGRQIWERDPDDGTSAWTVATVNAAEFGVKRTG